MCILLVEDEPLIRLLLAEELAFEGWQVVEAEDGDRAATVIAAPPMPITLLITDMQMPGSRNGLSVAAAMRGADPTTAIVLTTGRPEVLRDARPLRAHEGIVLKPFLPSEMIATVRRLIRLRPPRPQPATA